MRSSRRQRELFAFLNDIFDYYNTYSPRAEAKEIGNLKEKLKAAEFALSKAKENAALSSRSLVKSPDPWAEDLRKWRALKALAEAFDLVKELTTALKKKEHSYSTPNSYAMYRFMSRR